MTTDATLRAKWRGWSPENNASCIQVTFARGTLPALLPHSDKERQTAEGQKAQYKRRRLGHRDQKYGIRCSRYIISMGAIQPLSLIALADSTFQPAPELSSRLFKSCIDPSA